MNDEIDVCLYLIVCNAAKKSPKTASLLEMEDFHTLGDIMADTLIEQHIPMCDLYMDDEAKLKALGDEFAKKAEQYE